MGSNFECKTLACFCRAMPQRYAKENRTAHLTARSDKSVAYVTNNKRLYSTFCTVEASTDRHEASRSFFATAELVVCIIYVLVL